jgi:DNA-binding IscR family transcriptional regulator
VARAVWASETPLTLEQAAAAAGVSPGGSARILRLAKANGWIVSKPGSNGGYARGEIEPPPEQEPEEAES